MCSSDLAKKQMPYMIFLEEDKLYIVLSVNVTFHYLSRQLIFNYFALYSGLFEDINMHQFADFKAFRDIDKSVVPS